MSDEALRQAAEWVAAAEALLVTAGAGMGVDSGMPDFRGDEGFWRAYPPFAKLGLSFVELADPRWFDDDPELAWGFYGHRYNMYVNTEPHEGFAILRRWGDRARHGAFVFTSNVDGHFQKAGFSPERIVEIHGTIHHLQCLKSCGYGTFPAAPWLPAGVEVDEATMRARPPLPSCPGCGELARPNVLMFGDWGWEPTMTARQQERLRAWLRGVGHDRVVIVELGAGTGVPTVRRMGEGAASSRGAKLIRVNVREPEVPPGQLGLAVGALQALRAIDARLGG